MRTKSQRARDTQDIGEKKLMMEEDVGGDRMRDAMGSPVEDLTPNRKIETHPWRPADADAT